MEQVHRKIQPKDSTNDLLLSRKLQKKAISWKTLGVFYECILPTETFKKSLLFFMRRANPTKKYRGNLAHFPEERAGQFFFCVCVTLDIIILPVGTRKVLYIRTLVLWQKKAISTVLDFVGLYF